MCFLSHIGHEAVPDGGKGYRGADRLRIVVTRGGPGSTTEVLSVLSYVTGFSEGDMGSAAAIAWVTVVLVNVLVAIFLRALSKSVD